MQRPARQILQQTSRVSDLQRRPSRIKMWRPDSRPKPLHHKKVRMLLHTHHHVPRPAQAMQLVVSTGAMMQRKPAALQRSDAFHPGFHGFQSWVILQLFHLGPIPYRYRADTKSLSVSVRLCHLILFNCLGLCYWRDNVQKFCCSPRFSPGPELVLHLIRPVPPLHCLRGQPAAQWTGSPVPPLTG